MHISARRAIWFDTVWYQTVSLGLITLIAGATLALAHRATGPAILEAQARDVAASLSQVLPQDFAENDLLNDTIEVIGHDAKPLTIHRARRDGQIAAVVFQMSGRGYAGPIHIVMGVDRDGRVTGARVTRHTETPGLGDKIEANRDPWIHSFATRSLGDPGPALWAVKKDGGDFDQFAGATITPRAVVAAVKSGLELFEARQSAMLADTPPTESPPQTTADMSSPSAKEEARP